MNKKVYIIPSTSIVKVLPSRMVATSIEKTSETFDSGSMKFTKENENSWGSIWDE